MRNKEAKLEEGEHFHLYYSICKWHSMLPVRVCVFDCILLINMCIINYYIISSYWYCFWVTYLCIYIF